LPSRAVRRDAARCRHPRDTTTVGQSGELCGAVTDGVATAVSDSCGEVDSVVVTAVDIAGAVTGPGGAGSGSATLVELNATVKHGHRAHRG
jgi:hypothetical protein